MTPGLRRALLVLVGLGAVGVVVVGSTGVWLATHYRPSRGHDPAAGPFSSVAGGGAIHEVHVWTSIALVIVTVLGLGILLVELTRPRSGRFVRGPFVGGLAVLGALVVGLRSSRELRWD